MQDIIWITAFESKDVMFAVCQSFLN